MTNHLTRILSLKNIYDYSEFAARCKADDVVPMPWVTYAQKAQALIFAMERYPGQLPMDAYMQYIADNSGGLVDHRTITTRPLDTNPCTSCGGGVVR